MFTDINHGREEQYKNIGTLIILFVFWFGRMDLFEIMYGLMRKKVSLD
jgi:hypothetical protein